MNRYETDAQALVRLTEARGGSLEMLEDLIEAVLVGDPVDFSDELAVRVRDSFEGDDSCDELRHEIEHFTGACDDMNDNCPWYDEDDED